MKIKITCLVTLLLFGKTIAFAQNGQLRCGTDEMMKKTFAAHPEMLVEYQQEDARLKQIDQEATTNGYGETNRTAATVYIIPLVFHVIHMGGSENISDAQIIDEVRILNNDYRKLNADISAVVPAFTAIAADCEIEFRLAQKDPNGNCTNGIDRIYSTLTNSADDNSKLNDWPRAKYLNVWVVKSIGLTNVAAYATPPSGFGSSTDGVLIMASCVGSIGTGSIGNSRVLTHEIGHILNLKHVWGGTNDPGIACGDDNVADTPETMGHYSICPLSDATCNAGVIENIQNYMEYSYCTNMFTQGQRTRMRSALTSNTGQRSSLWTTTNLTTNTGVNLPAVLCAANFGSNSTTNSICNGGSITFNDLSYNGNPTSWNWTFSGGTPATSTDSVPTVQYNTAGTYDVSLTVSNASGTKSVTKTNYVQVNSSTAMYNGTFYSEGFEGTPIPNTDFQVNNTIAGTTTWAQTSVAAFTGSKCVRIVNTTSNDGNVDELIGPPINMTSITGATPSLKFKVANAQSSSTSADKLQVFVSTDCGQTWTLRYSLTGASLSTGGVQTGSFVPTSSQWAQKSASLSSYTTATNLYWMFRFTSNGGNNVYIDDINISGNTNAIDELTNNLNFNVYPNPAEENSVINFNLTEKHKVEVKITDVTGRKVSGIFNGELNAGEYNYKVNENANLSGGVYFVTLNIDGQNFSKKLIVK